MFKTALTIAVSTILLGGAVSYASAQVDPYSEEARQSMAASILQALQAQLLQLREGLPAQVYSDDESSISQSTETGLYCPNLSSPLGIGSRGEQVRELQKFISELYDVDPEEIVTGYFGRITEGYVRKFQKEQGLPVVGVVGKMTRASIKSICGEGQSSGSSSQSTSKMSPVSQTSTETSPPSNSSPVGTSYVPYSVPLIPSTTFTGMIYERGTNKQALGRYEANAYGNNFLGSSDSTRTGALENCLSNWLNYKKIYSYNCTWNGEEIFNGSSYKEQGSIKIITPDAGEKYDVGADKELSIIVEAGGLPQGSSVCTYLNGPTNGDNTFLFPNGNANCLPAKEGKITYTGFLVSNNGVALPGGQYQSHVYVFGPTLSNGDRPIYAYDFGESRFWIADAEVKKPPTCSLRAPFIDTRNGTKVGDRVSLLWNSSDAKYTQFAQKSGLNLPADKFPGSSGSTNFTPTTAGTMEITLNTFSEYGSMGSCNLQLIIKER